MSLLSESSAVMWLLVGVLLMLSLILGLGWRRSREQLHALQESSEEEEQSMQQTWQASLDESRERQQQAEQLIEQDPLVKAIVERFEGRVVKDSIRPLENSAG